MCARSGARYRGKCTVLGACGIMRMRRGTRVVHTVSMIRAAMKELRRKTFRTNCEGKWVVRRRHEPSRHECTKRERNQQDAGDQLATAWMC